MALPLRVPSVEMISLPSAFSCLLCACVTAAPLRVSSHDSVGRDVDFDGTPFPAGTGFAPLISFLVAGVEARSERAGAQCS